MEPLALSIDEAAKALGIGKTALYRDLAAGRLKGKKLGKRTLILQSDLEAFLASLTPYVPETAVAK